MKDPTIAGPYGPFGKYENYENLIKANDFASLINRTPIDVITELDYSKEHGYGNGFLKENWEAQRIGRVVYGENGEKEVVYDVRVDRKFSRWLEKGGFYDNVSRNIKISNPGIMVPKGKRSRHQPNVSLTAYDSVFNCRINDVGKMFSRLRNLEQSLINYLQSEEGQALMIELEEAGYRLPTLDALAVGLIPKEAVMAVFGEEDGYVLARNIDYYKQIARAAKAHGMTVGEYLADNPDLAEELAERATLAEEITHMCRGLEDGGLIARVTEEVETKEFVRKFYEKRKRGAGKHEDIAREAGDLEKIMKDDIETTPERYMELYSSAAKAGYSREDVDELVEEYLEEALEEGYEGEEAAAYAVNKAKADVESDKDDDSEEAEEDCEEADSE